VSRKGSHHKHHHPTVTRLHLRSRAPDRRTRLFRTRGRTRGRRSARIVAPCRGIHSGSRSGGSELQARTVTVPAAVHRGSRAIGREREAIGAAACRARYRARWGTILWVCPGTPDCAIQSTSPTAGSFERLATHGTWLCRCQSVTSVKTVGHSSPPCFSARRRPTIRR
jgi:hypothetical protein